MDRKSPRIRPIQGESGCFMAQCATICDDGAPCHFKTELFSVSLGFFLVGGLQWLIGFFCLFVLVLVIIFVLPKVNPTASL